MKNKNVILEHKDLFLGLLAVCFIAIISIMGNTEWFRASILMIPEKFDGATTPVAKVPNRFTWGGDNHTTHYGEIAAANLVALPSYSLAVGGKSPSEITENNEEKLAKLTYPVVYLGDYNIENRTEGKGSHLAVDIKMPIGTPIQAVANGKIIKVSNSTSGFGKHIVLEMPNVPSYPNSNLKTTLYASYNHLDEISVKEGDVVKRGQIIGKSGNTGTSTTPHLHFQIDNKDAPWHPYWPFTSSEAYAANLNFFTAVKAGLGKENAEKYTVSPMAWVEKNLTTAPVVDTTTVVEAEEGAEFEKFKISGEDSFYTDSDLTLKIAAEDSEGKVITEYKSTSDLKLSSNSNTAEFSKNLRFTNGVATLLISNRQAEKFTFTISIGDKEFTKEIETKKDQVEVVEEKIEETTEEVASSSTTTDSSETEETHAAAVTETSETEVKEETKEVTKEIEIPAKAKELDKTVKMLIQGVEKVSVGEKVFFDVFANDKEGNFADVTRDYAVEVLGVGKIEPQILHSYDFIGSKAKVRFSAEETGEAILLINGEEYEIEVVEAEKEVSKSSETEESAEKTEEVASSSTATDSSEAKETEEVFSEKEELFTDVSASHSNYEAIKYLKENEVVGGYADGSFQPNKIVSRVEALKMLFAGLEISTEGAATLTFPDTVNDAWYSPFVGAALNLGIVKGYPNGSFQPSKEVNRSEYYKILLLSAGISPEVPSSDPYSDVPAASWFGPYIAYVKENNLIDSGSNFGPSEGVSRAEVAESIFRLIQIK